MNRPIFFFIFIAFLFSCNRQQNEDFTFERIIFHSKGKGCEGYCPTYHIQIDSSKNVLLYSETVWKNSHEREIAFTNFRQSTTDENGYVIDSIMEKALDLGKDKSKMGYFRGHVTDSSYRKLITLLSNANLDSLEFDNSHCCDGINKTLIINYNKKTKYLKAMFPPDSLEPLFNTLYSIINQDNYIKTTDTFNLKE